MTRGGISRVCVVRVLVVLGFLLSAIRLAWIADDALITLRTALNITHGWGPGFNATESVQAFTHPLWFLMWTMLGAVTDQWIVGILILSALLAAGAVAVLAWSASSIPRLLVSAALLFLSNAFMDFTTSGLENSLAFVLVGVVFALTTRVVSAAEPPAWWIAALLGLASAGVMLTRLDLTILVVAPLILVVWRWRRSIAHLATAAVTLIVPLVVWFMWSYATYATLLPNTFLAKKNTTINQSEFIVQGLRYFWVSFNHDAISLIALVVGLALAAVYGRTIHRAWALGIVAYLGYVLWIGGDFMAGRFLAVLVYVAALLLVTIPAPSSGWVLGLTPVSAMGGALSVIMLLILTVVSTGTVSTALTNPQGPRWEVDQNFNAGVSDERGIYVADADSLKFFFDNLSLEYTDPDFAGLGDGTGLGRSIRALNRSAQSWPTHSGPRVAPIEVGVFCGYLGNIGIATGPTRHLVDACALTDRFLAEKPSTPAREFAWKPGHFYRAIPEGYIEAIARNDPMLVDDPAEAFLLQRLWKTIRR